MLIWKRNLFVCWIGVFIAAIGMSEVAPILPLYIHYLGVQNTSLVSQLSGIIFGITYLITAIFSPIWGYAADKVGRKPMILRAGIGLSIIYLLMGFVPNVYFLIALSVLQGAFTGYSTACNTLIATQTGREHVGYALATLSTAGVAGSLLGPTLSGLIEAVLGLQAVFFIISGLLLIAFIISLLFVQESFVRNDKKSQGLREIWHSVPQKELTIVILITFFVLGIGLYSIEPIMTPYVSQLSPNTSHIALISGLVFSATGLSNIISAPRLGKLSDKIGAHKVIMISLIVSGILYIPQAFVQNPWQLLVLRFLLGFAMGGLIPSISIMIKNITPDYLTGRIFGFNMSLGYLGVAAGSVLGGQIAGRFSFQYVFYITSALMFLNAVWVYFRVYKKWDKAVLSESFGKE
ncbi:multidrug efflux MFS transporter [Acetobacterium woodii]|uniref:Major facilitator superfamily MFS_1 transporter n=1 Tax=Acetobacterium woodii (strain ATCC 29683 / DSM 1030 / JCM 2381 / KCTC 1655 / WB1) TaxID=931626 RepID=H6LKY5_ACEWD|nr:multidrug efflux MFS transporter [Acetobacterium woodii]AFA50094.1 major facilitator superfamily MFS_1 transporter [Acetobacterium woodii DSM 1030]